MLMEGLFNILVSTPEIADFVGNGGSPPQYSVHHGSLRKGYWLPAVRFSATTSAFIVTNTGTADLAYQTIQFDCMAVDYLDAQRLKDAVKSLFKDYVGVLAEGTVIRASWLMNELDSPLEEGKGGYVFRNLLDIKFAYDATDIPVIRPDIDVTVNNGIDDLGLPQQAGKGDPD
jgi:hypothetical protein